MFIKASEGRSVLNPNMSGQLEAARARSLVVGFYHYLWPDNALDQADYFVGAVEAELALGDLLVCDWEKNRSDTVPSEGDKDAFLAEVKRLLPGHRVGLYVNASMWNASHRQPGDFLWVAHYGVQRPAIAEPWTFWQWTDTPIDQNFSRFTTIEALRTWALALIEEDDDVTLSEADLLKIRQIVQEELDEILPEIWRSGKVDILKAPTMTNPANTWTPASMLEDIRRRVVG